MVNKLTAKTATKYNAIQNDERNPDTGPVKNVLML